MNIIIIFVIAMPILNKSTRFPPLNTLRFHPVNKNLPTGINTWRFDDAFFYQQVKPYFQAPADYIQPVQSSDVITIYFDSLAPTASIVLLGADGIETNFLAFLPTPTVVAGNMDSKFGNQYYSYAFQWSPSLVTSPTIPDGIYSVQIVMDYTGVDPDPDTDTNFISERIQISSRPLDTTMLFTYLNNTNDYFVLFRSVAVYTYGLTGVVSQWGFRCDAYMDIEPGAHYTTFEDMLYEVQKLQSVPMRFGELNIGGNRGVPAWVLDKMNWILCCDLFAADGVPWRKEPGAGLTIKKVDGSILKAGTIKMRNNPASSLNAFEFNNYSSDTFRIHDDSYDDTHD